MKQKRKLKKKVVIFLILALAFIIFIGVLILTNGKKSENKVKVVDEIKEYGYVLENNKPKQYKQLFKELVKVLKADKVNEEEYAKLISQMFAVDFYDLNSKTSKNDIGGITFISEKSRENFALKASDTVYKHIEINVSGDRKQELPEVTNSSVKEIKTEKLDKKNVKDDNAYVVTVNLEYKKDLDYPKEVVVKLLHNDKKLEIYEME